VEEKAKGRMKEAAGALTGDEDKKAEGQAQQRKGAAGEEAAQKAKTKQSQRSREGARQAEAQGEGRALGQRRRHPLRTIETPAPLYCGPEPLRSFGSGLCMPPRSLNFFERRKAEVRHSPIAPIQISMIP